MGCWPPQQVAVPLDKVDCGVRQCLFESVEAFA